MPAALPSALSRRAATHLIMTPARGLNLARAFSSTVTLRQGPPRIPPESPLYINIPTPPQSQVVEEQHPDPLAHKGHLPLPRRVFKRRTYELPKTDPSFLERTTPLPTNAKSQLPPTSKHEARRRRLAEIRRTSLRDGLRDLWKRRETTDRAARAHTQAKLRHHQKATNAPPRPDEVFTAPTVPAVVLDTHVPQDPHRFQRGVESLARTEAIQEAKSRARQDSLQQLYMAARTFIVDEATLEREVERLFQPNHFLSSMTESGAVATNAWDLYGKPATVQDMLSNVMRTDSKIINQAQGDDDRTLKRQTRVAEELTGGPMDEV
jgi:hypothetical protein